MNKKCIGCGAILQSDAKNEIGYIKNEKLDTAKYCERCFKLINYGEFKQINKSNEEYINIYKNIGKTNDLVLFLVDIFNINKSIDMINKHINNKIILVITKYDIIPKNMKEEKIIDKIKKYISNNNVIDVVVVSSKTGYNINLLYDKIIVNKNTNNVYICGNTNSGKSTLINKFIKKYSEEDLTITTSILPSTTININEIKVNQQLTLIDTPGFLEEDNISNYITPKELKKVMPNSEIKPITYQLQEGMTLLIDNLLRIEYVKGDKNSFTFYISNDIIINRINTITNERGKNLKLTKIKVNSNEDVIVNGLCFIKVKNDAIINIYTIDGIGIYTRKSLI